MGKKFQFENILTWESKSKRVESQLQNVSIQRTFIDYINQHFANTVFHGPVHIKYTITGYGEAARGSATCRKKTRKKKGGKEIENGKLG